MRCVRSKHDPAECLADILENITRIQDYVSGLSKGQLDRDGRTRDAVERCLERICEAAVRLGAAAEELVPGEPWPDIRGMGNWLRHAYDRVDRDTIWDTVHHNLPSLKQGVETALAGFRGGSGRG
jgi:uncharacterized protein with HEPN domain